MSSKPVKASLNYQGETDSPLNFLLNPSDYTISSGTSWKQTPAKGKHAPKSEFTGTLPRTMSMTIQFIDQWNGVKVDVWSACEHLHLMTLPTDDSVTKRKPSAPVLFFNWAPDTLFFPCHLKSVSVHFTAFDENGEPTRATAAIVLEEVLDEPAAQNPTSGGPGDSRAHVVADGDTLHSIAWHEYDDASLWRGLADLNGIDDPMRLRIGQRLLVPPFAQVAARS
ncbi:MAG: LysM peptidoglycan-binding domain-containing protein [Gaiellales bacterium]